ncbi:MAG TPA: efflux RND transporter periplasmic adaptor subunit [Janthinobacterium sp.]|nr:efflux RND transporter periplasmic adaptor subunit [Janthinobacterium sp.]
METLPLSSADPLVRSKRWRVPVIGLIVAVLAGGGWTVMQSKGKAADQAADGAKKEAAKNPVYELARGDVATVEARALSVSLPLSGSLTPLTQATIKSKVSGQVSETTVQEGQAVAAGDVLARLDAADPRARLAQQQAALEQAQAKLALANKNQINNQALLKQKYISQNAYDTTQNTAELAQADVKSAQAQVELARIALNDMVIRAPISGIVSKRYVQAGEKLAPDLPVYTIVNLAQLTMEAQVPASDIPRVKIGQEVSFRVDGFDQRNFSGKVARINPGTEAGSRAMLVYIAVNNADGALRSGMFAKGSIVTQRTAVKPLVPLNAVRNENGATLVYKIENNQVVAQPVKLGLRNEDEGYAEVDDGLTAGASVIVAKLDGLKPGSSVKLAAASSAAQKG